jgi:hypothetical protein
VKPRDAAVKTSRTWAVSAASREEQLLEVEPVEAELVHLDA